MSFFFLQSVAYSDWNDAVAVSSNGGFVSVFSAKHIAAVSFKTAEFDKVGESYVFPDEQRKYFIEYTYIFNKCPIRTYVDYYSDGPSPEER